MLVRHSLVRCVTQSLMPDPHINAVYQDYAGYLVCDSPVFLGRSVKNLPPTCSKSRVSLSSSLSINQTQLRRVMNGPNFERVPTPPQQRTGEDSGNACIRAGLCGEGVAAGHKGVLRASKPLAFCCIVFQIGGHGVKERCKITGKKMIAKQT